MIRKQFSNHKLAEGKMAKQLAVAVSLLILSFLLPSCTQREDRIVAEVGGKPITVADVEWVFYFESNWSPEQVDSARMAELNKLIGGKLFALEGERRGYRDSPEVKENLDEVKKWVMIDHVYQKLLAPRTRVSESEVKRFYQRLGEEVRASHILVESEEEADSIYAEITRKGRRFGQMAKECSIDLATKARAGEIGWLKWGQAQDEIQEAAFSLKPGEISRPVKTDRGYHILRVEERREVERRPYAEASVSIRGHLKQAKTERLASELTEKLKEQARIEIDEEVLEILAEKTPEYEPDPLAIPPLPVVTQEDRERFLVSSTLGEWTVGKVLDEAQKPTYRPRFDQLEYAKEFVELLIISELLLDQAKQLNLENSPKVKLDVEKEIDMRMAGKFVREEIETRAQPSTDDLTEYYNSHIADYTEPEKVAASYILVKTEEKAEEVLRKLRAGENFPRLARGYSIHPTRSRGGDLGLFSKGTYPEIEGVAFSLKPGAVSEITKVKDGFAIIKVTKKEPARVMSFDEVRTHLEGAFFKDKRRTLIEEAISRLREETEVVIHHANLRLVGAELERQAAQERSSALKEGG